jgi:hypothetical protein
VVYTWVNHRDPEWQKLYEVATGRSLHGEQSDDRSADRFVSRDELRYSIRSVVRYAPWVRNIIIASNCSPPDWLSLEDPRIRWVDHREFLPLDGLPVFNSHAIESRLHHIPGLANHFLYFNDDFFLLRPMQPTHFYYSNGIGKCFFEEWGTVVGDVHPFDPDYLNGARNGKRLLERSLDCSVAALHRHTPYSLRKDVLFEMEERFPEDFARTARSRFRSITDISTASFLYHHYAHITGRALPATRGTRLVKQQQHDYVRKLLDIMRGKDESLTLCINDGAGSTVDPKWNQIIEDFLAARFSTPTVYESGVDMSRGLGLDPLRDQVARPAQVPVLSTKPKIVSASGLSAAAPDEDPGDAADFAAEPDGAQPEKLEPVRMPKHKPANTMDNTLEVDRLASAD